MIKRVCTVLAPSLKKVVAIVAFVLWAAIIRAEDQQVPDQA